MALERVCLVKMNICLTEMLTCVLGAIMGLFFGGSRFFFTCEFAASGNWCKLGCCGAERFAARVLRVGLYLFDIIVISY